jgi:cellulose synthase operon protein C
LRPTALSLQSGDTSPTLNQRKPGRIIGMKYTLFLLLFASAALVHAADADFVEAKTRLLHGNYAEAAADFEKLTESDRPASAFIGWSKALQSQGDYDKALAVVEQGLEKIKGDADLLARKAEVLMLRGRWEDAEKAADQALAKKPEHFQARWVKAELLRDRGQLEKADEAFRWFVRTYTARSNEDKDIKDPEELAIVGRAGIENANAHALTDQFDFILNEMYKDALKQDKDAWYIELQAGELLLEKYNRGDALDAFDKALKINPRAAEALVGKARAALQRFEVKDADDLVEQALKINPKLTSAIRVKIDLALMGGEFDKARKLVNEAIEINPRDESTLGRLGAIYVVERKPAELENLIADIKKFNPKPGQFYFELGERVEDRRLFTKAEQFFKKAIEFNPIMPWPRDGLGLLYMRMGKEEEASKELKAAFEEDKFNVRVANSLKVLKHLEKYKTITTDHYLVRYDPEKDSVLARFVADTLEQLYANYTKQFAYTPKEPILVEVFNSHEMFSGRTVALPDLHTIGACTGKMFAMVSPQGKGILKPFNWGRVLRHELVHIFNLEQTDMQVPHWLTEGLAVENEGIARPPEWNRVLIEHFAANNLLNLDTVTLGFIRPRSQDEWTLAYCQSNLYVEYIKKTFGDKSIGGLLAAYADGKSDADALKAVCNVEKKDFEKNYHDFLKDLVKNLRRGKPPVKPMTLSELQSEYDKKPGDPDIAARLAARLIERDAARARRLANGVLENKPGHPIATVVLAQLDSKAGRVPEAIKTLEGIAKGDDPDPEVIMELGKLYQENDENAKATEMFELGRKIDQGNPRWLIELAKLYKKSDDKAKRISVLTDLVALDADEFEMRKLLAQLLMEDGRPDEAAKAARDALEINVKDEEVQDVLIKALKAQKKDDEASRLKKLLQD